MITVGPKSVLSIGGAYTQTSGATLSIDLGGSPASGQFGQVAVSDSATLGGTLQTNITAGYIPQAGDSFKLMSFASDSGEFASTDAPLYRGGNLFGIQTNPTNITFTAAATVADLDVTTAGTTATSVTTGQNLTVNYSVANHGNSTAVTSWVDSVLPFAEFDPRRVVGAARPGDSHRCGRRRRHLHRDLDGRRPPLATSNYYVIVEVDSHGLVPDANRSNNILAPASPILVTVPALSLASAGGTPPPETGTVAVGKSIVYAVADPTGSDFNLTLTAGALGDAGLLVGFQSVPTAECPSSTFSPVSPLGEAPSCRVSYPAVRLARTTSWSTGKARHRRPVSA